MSESTSQATPNTPEPTQQPKLSPAVTPTLPTPLKPIIASWRFWAVMLIQSVLIAAVPFQSAMTYVKGQTVTLQTAPVDPYDLLRGYSQTLSYEIANIDTLQQLAGAEAVFETGESRPGSFFVTLQSPSEKATASPVPEAWEPVAVSLEYPESLQNNQVALEANVSTRGRVEYGLETYYMPESQRNDINDHIREVQRSEDQAFVVDVKVDSKGNSVPVSLWVSDREYRF